MRFLRFPPLAQTTVVMVVILSIFAPLAHSQVLFKNLMDALPALRHVETELADGTIRTEHQVEHHFDNLGRNGKARTLSLHYVTHHHKSWRFFDVDKHMTSASNVTCDFYFVYFHGLANQTSAFGLLNNLTGLVLRGPLSFECYGVKLFHHILNYTWANNTLRLAVDKAKIHDVFSHADMNMRTNYLHVLQQRHPRARSTLRGPFSNSSTSRRSIFGDAWDDLKSGAEDVADAAKATVHVVKDAAEDVAGAAEDAAEVAKLLIDGGDKTATRAFFEEITVSYDSSDNDFSAGAYSTPSPPTPEPTPEPATPAPPTSSSFEGSCGFDAGIVLDFHFSFRLAVKDHTIENITAVFEGDYSRWADIHCEGEYTWTGTKSLAEIKMGTFDLQVGPLPLVIQPQLDVDAELDLDVTGSFTLGENKTTVVNAIGFTYAKGHGAQGLWDYYTPKPTFTHELEVKVDVTVKIIPKIGAKVDEVLYASIPISLGLEGYANFQAGLGESCMLSLALNLLIELNYTATVSVFGKDLIDPSGNLYNKTIPLWHRCLIPAPANCTAGGVAGDGTLVDLTNGPVLITSDTDGFGPSQYRESQSCAWSFACNLQQQLQIAVNYSTEPQYDYLQLQHSTCDQLQYAGGSLFTYSGTGSEFYTGSWTRTGCLNFISDETTNGNGFSALVSCVPWQNCRASTDTSTVTLGAGETKTIQTSHGFLDFLETGAQNCVWFAYCPADYDISIQLDTNTPHYSYVRVHQLQQGETDCAGALIIGAARITGQTTSTIKSETNAMCVEFVTQSGSNQGSFTGTFSCVASATSSRRMLAQQTTVIKPQPIMPQSRRGHSYTSDVILRSGSACTRHSNVANEETSLTAIVVNSTLNNITFRYHITRMFTNGTTAINTLYYHSTLRVNNISNFVLTHLRTANLEFPHAATLTASITSDRRAIILDDDGCVTMLRTIEASRPDAAQTAASAEEDGITKNFYAGLGIGIGGMAFVSIVIGLVLFIACRPKAPSSSSTEPA